LILYESRRARTARPSSRSPGTCARSIPWTPGSRRSSRRCPTAPSTAPTTSRPKSRPAWSAATSAGVILTRTTRSYRRSWPGRRLL